MTEAKNAATKPTGQPVGKPAVEPRRRGPVRRFSSQDVLEAALRLIDREGYQQLTMRQLADEMSIGVMTLYGYVRTREDLINGIGSLVLDDLGLALDEAAVWHDQLAAVIRELHRVLSAHPGALEMLVAEPVSGPAFDRVRDLLLGILLRAGFSKKDTVDAVGALISYVVGLTLSQRARANEPPRNAKTGVRQKARMIEYPYLNQVAKEYASHMSERSFEYGLTHLINGIRSDWLGSKKHF